MKSVKKIILIIAGLCFSLGIMNAQSKALGLSFSVTSLGLAYEHFVESNNFVIIDLAIDTDDYMWSRSDHLGANMSLVWNIVFAERLSKYGNKVSFYAGPGIMAGYVTDLNNMLGATFGMKGRIGMECCFKRSIVLSASFSPILGCHITSKNDEIKMRIYKSGLLQAIVPEIGIKYAF